MYFDNIFSIKYIGKTFFGKFCEFPLLNTTQFSTPILTDVSCSKYKKRYDHFTNTLAFAEKAIV